MTKEKTIEAIKNYENYPNGLSKECRDYIIKALEQETVSKEDYDHEYYLRKELDLKVAKLEKQIAEQEPTTKNNLVDAISREDALMCLTGEFENRKYEPSELIKMFANRIKALSSVTPQEPKIKLISAADAAHKVACTTPWETYAWLRDMKYMESVGLRFCEVEK